MRANSHQKSEPGIGMGRITTAGPRVVLTVAG
jgi:hypothetical protein